MSQPGRWRESAKKRGKKSGPRSLQSGPGTATLEFQTCTWQHGQRSSSVLQANVVISHYKLEVESRRRKTQSKQINHNPTTRGSGMKDGFWNEGQVNRDAAARSTHLTSIRVPVPCQHCSGRGRRRGRGALHSCSWQSDKTRQGSKRTGQRVRCAVKKN